MTPSASPSGPATSTRRPNVLVFFTDQQRWDTTGLHGNPLGLTPVLDRLAAEGVSVDRSFTCQPVCAPSRASLQTGQYPTTTGVFRNGLSLPRDTPSLARSFRDAGYATGYIGKWHLAGDHTSGPVPEEDRAGYDHWLAANLLEFTSDAYETTLYDGDGAPHRFEGYRADALGTAAIDFIDRDRGRDRDRDEDRPFFLFLSFLEPHHQNSRDDYPAPTGYSDRYATPWVPSDLAALGGGNWAEHLPGYYGMVRRLDEVLGRVVSALERRGELDETVILFTSDHGCHFKTRNDEYKRSVHDASLRVPTVLRGPGLRGGVRLPELVSHVDLPPTLLRAAGVPVPKEMQGRSLLPLVPGGDGGHGGAGEDAEWPREVLFQISESEVGRGLRTDRWKYAATAPDADAWNDPRAERYQDAYLYDLRSDPDELMNLVTDPAYGHVLEELRQRLVRRIVDSGEPRPTVTAHEPAPQADSEDTV
ncbi:sulfatase-like hydrolase/transferase [Streptomyces rhizosphaericus]|uniref:Sulfatase-like hydrolase/transferase n=1 Tax=Streptomyces rhizosphaericus TaxID=114699 RepID=A0A6G4A7X4_9ACTN|nr:sulfatase-like hydrolase/transferase [Streptomyces rhizosphaericus]NEW68934.1 sulfatase-like hydrolase/transferase [Streptomyces rhizosphaericus]